jgi:hypothetical protein
MFTEAISDDMDTPTVKHTVMGFSVSAGPDLR